MKDRTRQIVLPGLNNQLADWDFKK